MFSGVQAGCNIGFVGNIASNSYGAARFFDVLNITERELERDLQVKEIKNELV
jgi:predicted NUDIX family phosphoesterase